MSLSSSPQRDGPGQPTKKQLSHRWSVGLGTQFTCLLVNFDAGDLQLNDYFRSPNCCHFNTSVDDGVRVMEVLWNALPKQSRPTQETAQANGVCQPDRSYRWKPVATTPVLTSSDLDPALATSAPAADDAMAISSTPRQERGAGQCRGELASLKQLQLRNCRWHLQRRHPKAVYSWGSATSELAIEFVSVQRHGTPYESEIAFGMA